MPIKILKSFKNKPVTSCSVALIKNEALLIVKKSCSPYKGYYSLPGGKVKWGEKMHECALRELKEETGFDAVITDFILPVEIINKNQFNIIENHFINLCYSAQWKSGKICLSEELIDARWVTKEEFNTLAMNSLALTPGLVEIADLVFARMGKTVS